MASNDILSRSVSSRSSTKGQFRVSAIRSIIRKDGLPLPLDKSEINDVDTPDIFESCSFVIPILIKYSKDIGKE
jgi:hypothetical protein